MLRRLLADLAIGWLQEEVLLQMYARFAMQPAVIPDVVAGWEQPPGSEDADTRRRRLAASAADGSSRRREEGPHQIGQMAVAPETASAVAFSSASSSGSDRLSGWRYRRRKAAGGERHDSRALTQVLDAADQQMTAGSAALESGRRQAAADAQGHHRRGQRQHQQQQQQQPAEGSSVGPSKPHDVGADQADPLLESLYPDLPPPMFAENAGADARRYRLAIDEHCVPVAVYLKLSCWMCFAT